MVAPVKTARIWLLLLLAVLLPLRGAMAAAMLCPMGSPVVHMEVHGHEGSGHHAHEGSDETGMHAHGSAGEEANSSETCNTCVSFCSMTPLLSAMPTVPEVQELAVVRFPPIADSPPSFVPEGQERPPRSI